MAAPSKVLDFLLICGKLKTTKRTGWVNHHVKLPESISDHMYRMGILSFLIDDEKIDKTRAMKVALVHDLAESLVGDITPFDGVTKEQKRKLEHDAMDKIRNTVGGKIGDELYEHWLEYENAETPEAKFVKDFDKFEMILTAHEYETAQNISLGQFYESTKGAFKTPLVQSWVAELEKRRLDAQKLSLQNQDVQMRTDLRPGDIGNIISLHGKIYSKENGYDGSFEAYVAESFGDLKKCKGLDISPHRVWLCEAGNELVGCVGIVKRTEERAQLRWLLLEKKYRGKGIGRKLAENAVEYCRKDLGAKVVFLRTIKGLEVGKLYQALGFKVVEETEMEIWGDTRTEQVWELTL
eukprot:Phypoly_transcript_12002.p1 GENE.Phypoly_transcript_12002~~Phypoly_transcript_12002.p1  ORF type:complete len:352 (+),score=43.57 Phypoly_transcript_12002:26-1081(+)